MRTKFPFLHNILDTLFCWTENLARLPIIKNTLQVSDEFSISSVYLEGIIATILNRRFPTFYNRPLHKRNNLTAEDFRNEAV